MFRDLRIALNKLCKVTSHTALILTLIEACSCWYRYKEAKLVGAGGQLAAKITLLFLRGDRRSRLRLLQEILSLRYAPCRPLPLACGWVGGWSRWLDSVSVAWCIQQRSSSCLGSPVRSHNMPSPWQWKFSQFPESLLLRMKGSYSVPGYYMDRTYDP